MEKIDTKDIKELEQALLKRLPESVHMLVLLRLANQQRFPSKIDVTFYLYREDAEQRERVDDNVFLVCIQRPNLRSSKGVILFSSQAPTESMINAFDKFLNWEEPQQFQSVQQPFWEMIWTLSRSHGKLIPDNNRSFPMIVHAITDIEKAKNLEIRKDASIEVRELLEEDIPQIIESKAKPHTKEQINLCLGSLLSCGSFENGRLASSVLLTPSGSYSPLYSPDEFKGRGLNQLVMRWISREAANRFGTFPLAEVEIFNEARKAILKKTGYEEVYHTRWFIYEPK